MEKMLDVIGGTYDSLVTPLLYSVRYVAGRIPLSMHNENNEELLPYLSVYL